MRFRSLAVKLAAQKAALYSMADTTLNYWVIPA